MYIINIFQNIAEVVTHLWNTDVVSGAFFPLILLVLLAFQWLHSGCGRIWRPLSYAYSQAITSTSVLSTQEYPWSRTEHRPRPPPPFLHFLLILSLFVVFWFWFLSSLSSFSSVLSFCLHLRTHQHGGGRATRRLNGRNPEPEENKNTLWINKKISLDSHPESNLIIKHDRNSQKDFMFSINKYSQATN